MSSNVGLILSLLFVAIVFLFGADLITLQAAYTALENTANDIAFDIMWNSSFTKDDEADLIASLKEDGITYTTIDSCKTDVCAYGETVSFNLSRTIDLFLFSNDMTISVSRSAVLGYYGN
ncbi:MAG: hypothetical protein LUB56_00615 [Coprobacillus sp.]|nr:hypothetical protein [Coprobacillus sp.]